MTDLIAMRKAASLSQEEFWGRVGITQSGGSRYERGRPVPEPVTMLLMLAYGDDKQRDATVAALVSRPAVRLKSVAPTAAAAAESANPNPGANAPPS